MPISVLILGATAILQGGLLILSRRTTSRKLTEWLSVFGFLAAAVAMMLSHNDSVATTSAMLDDQPIFRFPRAALFLASLLLSRSVVATRELPEGRKPEVLFLLTILGLICDLLILSRHGTLTCILLVIGSWAGVFLGGLAYRGRLEAEAVFKYWIQASLSLAAGFGAVVLLAVVAGGAHYDVISAYLKVQQAYSAQSLLVVAGLLLPFLMVGGFFPFHFVPVDRDNGVPWTVQTILSVVFQGAVAVAMWKMGVEVFGHSRRDGVAEGLRVMQLCGLVGGFWLALFALAQDNSKRLFSALIGAQWSGVIAAGALPSLLSVTAMTYAFSAIFVWSAVLGFVWSRFQEWAKGDNLSDVYGVAKAYRTSGLILLLALASPLCIPGFPGFPTLLYLLAAMMEQRSLFFLGMEVVLFSLLCLSSIRIGTDLLFRPMREANAALLKDGQSFFRYTALDWAVICGMGVVLLAFGFFWHRLFMGLSGAASAFIQ